MLKAIVISGISGIFVLTCGFVLFAWVYDQPKDIASIQLDGSQMLLHRGTGHFNGKKLIVTNADNEQRIRIISKPISFNAKDMPFMAWTFSKLSPRSGVWVAWVTKLNPQKLNMAPAIIPLDSTGVYLMKNYPDWKGEIVTIGFGFDGQMYDPVILDSIEIKPYSMGSMLESIWDSWTAFEGWSLRSINVINGGSKQALIRPTPIVIIWILISLIFCKALVKKNDFSACQYASVLCIAGWIILDFRWQLDLFRQNYLTYHLYSGKTLEQKHLLGKDRRIFIFSEEIKKRLPDMQTRVYLTGKGLHGNIIYEQPRLQYFLLPYNVSYFENPSAIHAESLDTYDYSFDIGKYVKQGEFVVVLGNDERVQFNSETGLIRFSEKNKFQAQKLFHSNEGTLYKINDESDNNQ